MADLAIVAVLCASLLNSGLAERTDVTVQCEAGTFIGFQENVELDAGNVTMTKFLGVPFAEPPVGDLRFRKPVAKALTEPYRTQKFGPACLQLYSFFPPMDHSHDSEDCLYLNIFKPEVEIGEGKLPVMVWIYGGGFNMGDAEPYKSDALAANGPVIVVTLNYRITVWGFLSTGDANAPGNYGLWDQHLAIKWVHQNIEAFGGDPQKVTIFGESAGSASTIFQGLYPGNTGLFQRIIAQSGTAAGFWPIRPNPLADAKHMASLVECENSDLARMMECLRSAPVEKLNASLSDLRNWNLQPPMPFLPIVDGQFVLKSPSDSIDIRSKTNTDVRKQFASYDLMIGLNSGEGASSISPLFGIYVNPENFLPNKTEFEEQIVPSFIKLVYGESAPAVLNDLVVAEYTDTEDPDSPDKIRQMVADMFGDLMFLEDTYRVITSHADLSDRQPYMYYLNILPYKSFFPRPSWFNKPLHADDLMFTFGNMIDVTIPGLIERREFQDWEKKASENIMTLWTNFAKTGNPNQPRDIGVDWLPYTPTRHRYLELSNDVTASRLKERLSERRAKLWSEIVPAIMKASKCEEKAPGTCSTDSYSP